MFARDSTESPFMVHYDGYGNQLPAEYLGTGDLQAALGMAVQMGLPAIRVAERTYVYLRSTWYRIEYPSISRSRKAPCMES